MVAAKRDRKVEREKAVNVCSKRSGRKTKDERENEKKIKILSFLLDDQWSNVISFNLNFIQRIFIANSIILTVLIYSLPCLRYFPIIFIL